MNEVRPMAEELARVRSALARQLPFSPLDYVPGLSLEADRKLWAEELTRTLLHNDDYRLLCHAADGAELAVFAERLPWDSSFFGYGVVRLNGVFPLGPWSPRELDYGAAVGSLVQHARQRGAKYLFATVDPRDLPMLRALGAQEFALIETRLHYHYPLPGGQYVRLPDHVVAGWNRFREATPDDIPSLARVAREVSNPFDRFHGDPFLAPADVDRLMETWVTESVYRRFADLTIVPDTSEPRAFVTFRLHKDRWTRWGVNLIQAVFSAVAPEELGWFVGVWPELTRYLRGQGAHYCFGKTQLTLGLDQTSILGRGEHVFRRLL